jgi:hypothetical protein
LTAPGADPFTATKGTTLLDQVGTYRLTNAAVRARDSRISSPARISTAPPPARLCRHRRVLGGARRFASQSTFGTTVSALIMAHEIGTTRRETHDGGGHPCQRRQRFTWRRPEWCHATPELRPASAGDHRARAA